MPNTNTRHLRLKLIPCSISYKKIIFAKYKTFGHTVPAVVKKMINGMGYQLKKNNKILNTIKKVDHS